jgi:HSP20 family protein
MTIVKREPLREIEDIFDRYTRSLSWPLGEMATKGDWAPRVDISETDTELTIQAELPDVRKEDMHIRIEDGVLEIRGERKHAEEEKGRTYHRVERFYGTFYRSFALPDTVDEERVQAKFRDGVLEIRLPKREQPKRKRIDVKLD